MKQKKTFRKSVLLGLVLMSLSVLAFKFIHPRPESVDRPSILNSDYNVNILRDTWGVPHIFGVTDPDVSYGLAYAHAEDDFETIQKAIMAARGKLATILGKKFAPSDYMVQLLRIWDVINEKFERDISPDVKMLCKAYAEGINHYADLHPKVVAAGLLPVTAEDVVAGYVFKVPLFFGLHNRIKELFEEERKYEVSERANVKYGVKAAKWEEFYGSNGFAVSPNRSANGETFLAVNSHQPWEGPVTWYEAHLHSEDGWDMTGGTFPGAPVLMVGHNRHLGWVHTVNKPDLVDTYVLEINPDNPNQYKFDGEWLELEVRDAPIEVELLDAISWTFHREALWSVYGPVIRRPHGTYALRYAGMGDVRQLEQWYRMNKARDFQEWDTAMQMMAIPKFNCVYADYQGNIAYIYNGNIPVRAEGYDWSKYLPGNTSETLWTTYLPYSDLPKVINPVSGFVQSCNNSPFKTTSGDENPFVDMYSTTFGIETNMTNRAMRALELFGGDTSITEQEFYEYKFDMAYSENSIVAHFIKETLSAPLPDGAIAQEAVDVLRSWDLMTNPENTGAALAILTYQPFVKSNIENPTSATLLAALIKTARLLKEKFGRVDVAWSKINRLIHGDLDVGMGGGPDVLHAVYGEQMKDGRLKGFVGDCYSVMATWEKDGSVHSQSIHQYGSATLDKTSPHYADQARIFIQRKMKPAWMDEKDIRANLEREYTPGEEQLTQLE